jgi:hypothetical protein
MLSARLGFVTEGMVYSVASQSVHKQCVCGREVLRAFIWCRMVVVQGCALLGGLEEVESCGILPERVFAASDSACRDVKAPYAQVGGSCDGYAH